MHTVGLGRYETPDEVSPIVIFCSGGEPWLRFVQTGVYEAFRAIQTFVRA